MILNYLHNRFKKLLLNGQTSEWKPIKADVPQGSILGPLFFKTLFSNEDISIFSIVNDTNKFLKI